MLRRLKKRSDFLKIARHSRVLKYRSVVFQIAQSNTDHLRVGFTASRRQVGKAVERNRAKRRLRALCETYLKSLNQFPFDIVCIAKKTTPLCVFQELEKAFESLQAYLIHINELDNAKIPVE